MLQRYDLWYKLAVKSKKSTKRAHGPLLSGKDLVLNIFDSDSNNVHTSMICSGATWGIFSVVESWSVIMLSIEMNDQVPRMF